MKRLSEYITEARKAKPNISKIDPLLELIANIPEKYDPRYMFDVMEAVNDITGAGFKRDYEGYYFARIGEYDSSDRGAASDLYLDFDQGYTEYIDHSRTHSVKKERDTAVVLRIKCLSRSYRVPFLDTDPERTENIMQLICDIMNLKIKDLPRSNFSRRESVEKAVFNLLKKYSLL